MTERNVFDFSDRPRKRSEGSYNGYDAVFQKAKSGVDVRERERPPGDEIDAAFDAVMSGFEGTADRSRPTTLHGKVSQSLRQAQAASAVVEQEPASEDLTAAAQARWESLTEEQRIAETDAADRRLEAELNAAAEQADATGLEDVEDDDLWTAEPDTSWLDDNYEGNE